MQGINKLIPSSLIIRSLNLGGLIILYFLPASIPLGAQVQSGEMDWEKLQQGEIIVEKIRDEEGMPGIRAIFTLPGTRKELWGMLTDYDNFCRIYGGIDSLRVIHEDEYGARVQVYQDIRIQKIQFVLQRQYEKPGYRLSWDRVSGDLKMIKGAWDILDTPDVDLRMVVYTSYFKYTGIIPTSLSRNWAMKEVQNMALSARSWIRDNRVLYSR